MKIKGQPWRSLTSKMKWPLAEAAKGGKGDQVLPDSLLLDMRVSVPYPARGPFHIRNISGSNGFLVVEIADDRGVIVATSRLSSSEEVNLVYTNKDNIAGIILTTPGIVSSLVGGLEGRTWTYGPRELPLAPIACVEYIPAGMQAITDGRRYLTSNVNIEARNGVHFVKEGDAIRVDLHGEEMPSTRFIKTINGRTINHLWLAAEPESELRITGNKVTTRRNS